MKREDHIQAFTKMIWAWFEDNKREFPWRDLKDKNETQRAYKVLVSEVMLQQTQTSRVKIVFKNFMEAFPTLKSLASASNKQVIMAWRGMGYNMRALRLRDAARSVMNDHAGVIPKDMESLLQIKGIGPYTAAAIRNFAFHVPTPCLDTNIRRVLHRTFIGPETAEGIWKKDDRYLLELAEEVLQSALTSKKYTAADWHAALMDYGALVCTKVSPKWEQCPLTKAGLMKAAYKVPVQIKKDPTREPGRMIGSKFVPNRIIRGKIVEALRDEHKGLSFSSLGSEVCLDWEEKIHKEWLSKIIESLKKDAVIKQKKEVFVLA